MEIPAWVVALLLMAGTVSFLHRELRRKPRSVSTMAKAIPRLVLAVSYVVFAAYPQPVDVRMFVVRACLVAWMLLDIMTTLVFRDE